LQLGRYQILKQLATGDVADVLLARASGLEGFARHVVIKCIRKELASEQRLVEAFVEEARIAASLHHQNVVQVHDIGEQDGAVFFAMEYVHGEDVRRLLGKVRERREHVPLEHVIAIVTATAAGLHHAHEQRTPSGEPLGLVHRDVCPANILVGYDGSVKLVDFGMAKAALRSTKTASGSLKGKASYMSPEQCMGKVVDRRTDTFALGIVLYELVTAHRLFKGATEYLTMTAIVEGAIPPPSTYRGDLPPALDEIVLRALAREPEARFQTAEDLREALERFALDQQLRASNKALADYFTALFGQRLEPWHDESQLRPSVTSFDDTSGKGLVAAPEADDDLIAKYAPRSTAPIMLAQSIATSNAQSDAPRNRDAEDTRNERRPSGGEEEYGRTVVATPLFVDEESTIARDEKVEEAAVVLGIRPSAVHVAVSAPDDDDAAPTLTGGADDDAAPTLTGHNDTDEAGPTLTGLEDRTTAPSPAIFDDLPPRARSEHMYVGPPAPPPPIVRTFFTSYQRTIVIAASAGIVLLVVALLGMRACG
jgi:serine/threonine protein kinase